MSFSEQNDNGYHQERPSLEILSTLYSSLIFLFKIYDFCAYERAAFLSVKTGLGMQCAGHLAWPPKPDLFLSHVYLRTTLEPQFSCSGFLKTVAVRQHVLCSARLQKDVLWTAMGCALGDLNKIWLPHPYVCLWQSPRYL